MAPVALHLTSIRDEDELVTSVRNIKNQRDRPLYICRCHHWIHAPTLSVAALTGPDQIMHDWTHLIVRRTSAVDNMSLPVWLEQLALHKWTIAADVPDEYLDSLATEQKRHDSSQAPPLPKGWSPSDHSGLDDAMPPEGVELSLATPSTSFGEEKTSKNAMLLKDFVRSFGKAHPGPVAMFNLLAYLPGQKMRYFEYVAAFQSSIGIRYGGEAILLGPGPVDWSSRIEEYAEIAVPEKGGSEVWETTALVWYPSIWHFAKMLDDPEYADVDRRYKGGVLRDNPLICCTELQY